MGKQTDGRMDRQTYEKMFPPATQEVFNSIEEPLANKSIYNDSLINEVLNKSSWNEYYTWHDNIMVKNNLSALNDLLKILKIHGESDALLRKLFHR